MILLCLLRHFYWWSRSNLRLYFLPQLDTVNRKWKLSTINSKLILWCGGTQYWPAIQSTAMPSTRLMLVVMTSSRQVWSRLARDILFSPISVQYTVSFPANYTIPLMTGDNGMMNAAAMEVVTFSNKAKFYFSTVTFTKCHVVL